jgi:hypothetical protein
VQRKKENVIAKNIKLNGQFFKFKKKYKRQFVKFFEQNNFVT